MRQTKGLEFPASLREAVAELLYEMRKYYEVKYLNADLIMMTIERACYETQAIKEIKEKINNVN